MDFWDWAMARSDKEIALFGVGCAMVIVWLLGRAARLVARGGKSLLRRIKDALNKQVPPLSN